MLTGGLRLANIIKSIYGSSSIEEEVAAETELVNFETAEVEQLAFLQ